MAAAVALGAAAWSLQACPAPPMALLLLPGLQEDDFPVSGATTSVGSGQGPVPVLQAAATYVDAPEPAAGAELPPVCCVALAADCQQLATGGNDNQVAGCCPSTAASPGVLLAAVPRSRDTKLPPSACMCGATRTHLISAHLFPPVPHNFQMQIKIWDVERATVMQRLLGHEGWVWNLLTLRGGRGGRACGRGSSMQEPQHAADLPPRVWWSLGAAEPAAALDPSPLCNGPATACVGLPPALLPCR